MDEKLTQLQKTLKATGIDATSLGVLCQTPEERLYGLTVRGSEAISVWTALRENLHRIDHWPILVGQDEDTNNLRERVRSRLSVNLQSADAIDPEDWFEQRHQQFIEEIEEFGYREKNSSSEDEGKLFYGIPRGPWPEGKPANPEFRIPLSLVKGKPLPKVHLVFVPTLVSWHVPAHLRFGGWNECPSDEEHAAIMKYWHEHFGAEVVGITNDVVEMLVKRPPSTKNEALALAREQYLYCQDIVEQGTETLEALAWTLLGGRVWYFWWD
ncbi:MAG TPA: DUF4253 domain-containing protein [Gemmataceae bacterium]|nr:DUF4253 domain-containing protein [Gemmataceae bacterium]